MAKKKNSKVSKDKTAEPWVGWTVTRDKTIRAKLVIEYDYTIDATAEQLDKSEEDVTKEDLESYAKDIVACMKGDLLYWVHNIGKFGKIKVSCETGGIEFVDKGR